MHYVTLQNVCVLRWKNAHMMTKIEWNIVLTWRQTTKAKSLGITWLFGLTDSMHVRTKHTYSTEICNLVWSPQLVAFLFLGRCFRTVFSVLVFVLNFDLRCMATFPAFDLLILLFKCFCRLHALARLIESHCHCAMSRNAQIVNSSQNKWVLHTYMGDAPCAHRSIHSDAPSNYSRAHDMKTQCADRVICVCNLKFLDFFAFGNKCPKLLLLTCGDDLGVF